MAVGVGPRGRQCAITWRNPHTHPQRRGASKACSSSWVFASLVVRLALLALESGATFQTAPTFHARMRRRPLRRLRAVPVVRIFGPLVESFLAGRVAGRVVGE